MTVDGITRPSMVAKLSEANVRTDGQEGDSEPLHLDDLADDAIIKRPQVCSWLGISPKTLIRMEARGELPVVRITARCIGYRVGTIRRLIAERESCQPTDVGNQ